MSPRAAPALTVAGIHRPRPASPVVGMGYYHDPWPSGNCRSRLSCRVADRAAAAAKSGDQSLSAWLNRAAEDRLALEDGLAAVREWEAEHGVLTAEEKAAAEAILDGSVSRPKRRRVRSTKTAAR